MFKKRLHAKRQRKSIENSFKPFAGNVFPMFSLLLHRLFGCKLFFQFSFARRQTPTLKNRFRSKIRRNTKSSICKPLPKTKKFARI